MRSNVAPGLAARWPSFCLKMAAAGHETMLQEAFKLKTHCTTAHIIHGVLQLAPGKPFTGPLTQWFEAAFAQHSLLGAPEDAYSVEVLACSWFAEPVQVFMRLGCNGQEQMIEMRPHSMVFRPAALRKLLSQQLVAASPGLPKQSAANAFAQHNAAPENAVAIQVAAPLVLELKQSRLKELVLRASWPHIFEGFPPAWLGQLPLSAPSAEASAQSWRTLQNVLETVRQLATSCNDESLRNKTADAIAYLEQVARLV